MTTENIPDGLYLVRYRWFNKMNQRQFDEHRLVRRDGEWRIFSGAQIVEYTLLQED